MEGSGESTGVVTVHVDAMGFDRMRVDDSMQLKRPGSTLYDKRGRRLNHCW